MMSHAAPLYEVTLNMINDVAQASRSNFAPSFAASVAIFIFSRDSFSVTQSESQEKDDD